MEDPSQNSVSESVVSDVSVHASDVSGAAQSEHPGDPGADCISKDAVDGGGQLGHNSSQYYVGGQSNGSAPVMMSYMGHPMQNTMIPGMLQQPGSAQFGSIVGMGSGQSQPMSPGSVHKAGGGQWPQVAFSRGPDKKKRQREDFNQAQLKRLVEVYDMEESQRPDRDHLAKELDLVEGGRHVDAAAIKAWMKNRYHSLKRTAGSRTLVPGERKERQDFNSSQLKRLLEIYEMDPSQRPDRELIAKEIDKLDAGRPVTQYDVLAWMQTRKRMIKKKEDRTAMLKEQMRATHSASMHTPVIPGAVGWHVPVQQPFLIHPPMSNGQGSTVDGQPPPPPSDGEGLSHEPSSASQGTQNLGAGVVGQVGLTLSGLGSGGGLPASALAAKQHNSDRIKRPRMDYNDAQVFRLVQAYESGEKTDPEKLSKEIDGLEGGRQVDAPAVKAWLKNRLRFSESQDRKKRQRYDFNQAQLKRLLEVYEMSEAERPDREAVAQELDNMEGGRRVTRADVKAWLKNRHHANRRRSGQEPNSSLHAKLRRAQQVDLKHRSKSLGGLGGVGMQDYKDPSHSVGMMPLTLNLVPQLSSIAPEHGAKTADHYMHYVSQNSGRFLQYLHQQHQEAAAAAGVHDSMPLDHSMPSAVHHSMSSSVHESMMEPAPVLAHDEGSKDPSGSMTDINSGVSDTTAGSMADVTGGAVTDVGGASMTREREREQQQYTREREREHQQYDATGGSVTDVAAPAAPEEESDPEEDEEDLSRVK